MIVPAVTGALKFVKKHPVATAGLAGTAYVANDELNRAEGVEQELLNNRTGAPMGRYVYAELEAFENRKAYLDEKTAFCKNAVVFEKDLANRDNPGIAWGHNLGADVSSGFGKAIGQQTVGGIASFLGSIADHLRDKIVLAPKREAIFNHLVQNDPIIAQYEASQPGSAARAFMTMSRFAPELSTDPNVVTSFLRETAQTGGTMNHVMVKQLAEAESAIQSAKGEGRR